MAARIEAHNYTTDMLETLRSMGDRVAVIHGTRRITGTEAFDAVLRFAATLRDIGIGIGDGVGLFVENSPEALFLTLAVHFVGGRLVFVPPEPGNSELAGLVGRAEVKALLCDPVFTDRTARIGEQVTVPHLFGIGASPIADDFLEAARDRVALTPDAAADGSHVVTLLYTGGTSGLPKLATHRSGYYESLTGMSANFADETATEPRWLICTLLTHSTGHISALLGLLSGHTLVLQETSDPGEALSIMDEQRVARVTMVTPMIYETLDHPNWPADGFPALQSITYGGSAAAPARLAEAIHRFGPVLAQVYGSTEAGLISVLTPPEHDLSRPQSLASCGRPMPGIEVELRDEQGRPVSVGQTGEVCVRSPQVMAGYWNDPQRTAEVLDDEGWFRTGDVARQDEDGYLYLFDRVRDIIVTGRTADNVYSRLLDDFLISLPDVRDAAVVGLPGGDNTEQVHVVLVPTDATTVPDFDDLTSQIVDELGELYAPASYSVTESLPRTTVGKTDKKALRAALLHDTIH
jgi:fatty-acyl-CoA synthase